MNRKGLVLGALLAIEIAIFGTVAAVWHIPAWSKAKAEGKTAEYQAQKMYPQEEISRWPGGANYVK